MTNLDKLQFALSIATCPKVRANLERRIVKQKDKDYMRKLNFGIRCDKSNTKLT